MALQLQFAFTPGWVQVIVPFCTIFLEVQVVKLKELKNEKGYPPKLYETVFHMQSKEVSM